METDLLCVYAVLAFIFIVIQTSLLIGAVFESCFYD